MSRPPLYYVQAFCLAVVLAVAAPAAAQSKFSPFIGATRGEVVQKLGEPKNNLKAGAREMLFFAHWKLTLRNGVVVEAEELFDEPVVKRAPDAPATSAAGPAPTNASSSTTGPAQHPTPATGSAPNTETTIASPTKSSAGSAAAPIAPKPPAPQLEIKLVKPTPNATKSMSRALAVGEVAPPAGAAAINPTRPQSAVVPDSRTTSVSPVLTPGTNTAPANDAPVAPKASPFVTQAERSPSVEEIPVPNATPTKPKVDPKKKAEIRHRWRLRRDAETDEPVEIFSTQSYVIGAIAMLAGIGYLWWRRTQRNLALAATAVSRTPFEPIAAADTGGQFTADFVSKQGAKQFERLVAAYYAKTGVVAERATAAPDTPVHIKIYWKGETKPFAGVQCHANPPVLIGAKPLQDLFAALAAAEIRRGYVVTTGKFNVEARDYAEEKHFTLLPGDIFLEKLNALPGAARSELLKEMNSDEAPPVPPPALAS